MITEQTSLLALYAMNDGRQHDQSGLLGERDEHRWGDHDGEPSPGDINRADGDGSASWSAARAAAARRRRQALVRCAGQQYTASRRRPARFQTTVPHSGQAIMSRTRSNETMSASVASARNGAAYARITKLRICAARAARRRARYSAATHA